MTRILAALVLAGTMVGSAEAEAEAEERTTTSNEWHTLYQIDGSCAVPSGPLSHCLAPPTADLDRAMEICRKRGAFNGQVSVDNITNETTRVGKWHWDPRYAAACGVIVDRHDHPNTDAADLAFVKRVAGEEEEKK